jgi:hypothetical protein
MAGGSILRPPALLLLIPFLLLGDDFVPGVVDALDREVATVATRDRVRPSAVDTSMAAVAVAVDVAVGPTNFQDPVENRIQISRPCDSYDSMILPVDLA